MAKAKGCVLDRTAFATEWHAQTHLEGAGGAGAELVPFVCPDCGRFHVAHPDRLGELFERVERAQIRREQRAEARQQSSRPRRTHAKPNRRPTGQGGDAASRQARERTRYAREMAWFEEELATIDRAEADRPARCRPGSHEKALLMGARYRFGLPIHQRGDATFETFQPGRTLAAAAEATVDLEDDEEDLW